jgi:hypothetical protein
MKLRPFEATLILAAVLVAPSVWAQGPGLPSQTWPAGTHLSTLPKGGRITTFHRGYLYLGGIRDTSIWDISNPIVPDELQSVTPGLNGHSWFKIGDFFWRQYWIPEHGNADPPQFQSLADPLNRVVWTDPMPFSLNVWYWHFLSTYPLYVSNTRIDDVRTQQTLTNRNLFQEQGINAGMSWRLGNLLLITPGDEQNGMSVWNVGNPSNPVLLDVLNGNYRQYTTTWQIWRNYVVFMAGDNTNGPNSNANLVAIDISDPTDLQVGFTLTHDQLPGRYVHFQDQYAFAGRGGVGYKFNLETMSSVQTFNAPQGHWFEDFQWIPLGHVLLVSQAQENFEESFLFAHQSGLDTTPPTVGYHLPAHGAVFQPVKTVIGLVINETLDANTINSSTIQVVAHGSPTPLPITAVSTSYNVINVVPEVDLAPNTTYEVRILQDGIHDVAGNGIDAMSFRFSTGATVNLCVFCDGFEAGNTSAWSGTVP